MASSSRGLVKLLALALSGMAFPAPAQEIYPSAAIRVVLGFPPGATTDVLARALAQRFSAQMHTNAIVDNKPGANGNIGADFVAKSKPDGHTVLVNTPSVILSPALGEKLNYNVMTDLAPVALVCSGPMVLLVHPSIPVNTAGEMIAHIKANPGKLAYGSGGVGNNTHLTPLLFLQTNGLSALHVPYKGTADALTDIVGGRIQFAMQNIGAVAPLVKDKRIRALAITSLKRSALLPDVPTLNESAMPGFEAVTYFGVLVPAKTPATIIRKLNIEILKALQEPEFKSRIEPEAVDLLGSTPEEYGAYLKNELERWTKVVKSGGIE